ncbi:MFS transporter [Amycolatopsis saalfeldensis]|uniref:MFS transporter, DHA2 family, multidrug resistance protein n=1 Tax=Amycolatopsis saalfeldensis TaxID=394193 RepID=A0A1H8YBM0_9PSEU|nr:MFS transporter [Amycolatopsis saalfeldensis]SEP49497.1 MFS transporter, DHA2 family, multidrug resistance protein [Amycolatopsis saalfeldensis]
MTTLTRGRKAGIIGVCVLAQILIAVDMTVLHLAIPAVSEALHPSTTQALWIADGYGFALAGLLITMGNLGDRIGRKRLLLSGAAVFGLVSVATAYAPNAELLIALRVLLGMSAATLMPSTLSILRNTFTGKERTAAIGVSSGLTILGFGLGPLVGGALLDHFWWGSVFLVNVPVVAVLILVELAVLPESRNPRPGRIDLVSVGLSLAGILGVVYTIKEIAYKGLDHWDVYAAAVVGVGCLLTFVLRQPRLSEPLMDLKLFGNRAFSATIGVTVLAMFAQLTVSLMSAQYFQLVLGWSPLKSGLAGLPGMGGALVGGTLGAVLVKVLGRAGTVTLGCAASALGFALYSQIDLTTAYPYLVVTMAVFGIGLALVLTVATDTVLGVVPKERAGAASAISETATELGGALGIAVLGSLLGSLYRNGLVLPGGLSAAAADSARDTLGGAVQVAAQVPGGQALLASAREAFVGGLQVTMLGAAGLMVVVTVVAWVALKGVPKVLDDPAEINEPVLV